MPRYALLFRDSPTATAGLSAEEIQAIIARYRAWSERLEAEGRYAGGDKLADGEGRILRSDPSGVRITDGPYSETKEIVGGFVAVQAADYDEAVEIARGCPHAEFGTIEIRRIEET